MRSPAVAGALTAKVCEMAAVPDEKTEMSQGNIFTSPAHISEESIEWRILPQKK